LSALIATLSARTWAGEETLLISTAQGCPAHGRFQIVPPAGLERADPHGPNHADSAPGGEELAAERTLRGRPLGRAEIP
jgi:hypothetical protein